MRNVKYFIIRLNAVPAKSEVNDHCGQHASARIKMKRQWPMLFQIAASEVEVISKFARETVCVCNESRACVGACARDQAC